MLIQHLALMALLNIVKPTSWALEGLHKKAETIQGGHPPGIEYCQAYQLGTGGFTPKHHSVGCLATRLLSSQTREAIGH